MIRRQFLCRLGLAKKPQKKMKNRRRKAIEVAGPYSAKLCWVAARPAALWVGGKVRVAMEDPVGEPKVEKKRTSG